MTKQNIATILMTFLLSLVLVNSALAQGQSQNRGQGQGQGLGPGQAPGLALGHRQGRQQSSELEFTGTVGTVTPGASDEEIMTVIVQGVDVAVIVNEDTRLTDGGDELTIEDFEEGDAITVSAYFSDFAVVAEELRMLERGRESFRLRGLVTEVEGDIEFSNGATATTTPETATRITLLGVDIHADSRTRITRRGSGMGNRVPADSLAPGDQLHARGTYEEGNLWADHIHVGTRELGQIEITGTVSEEIEEGFILDIHGGDMAIVEIDDDTEVRGQIAAGATVYVEGALNEELSVLASQIRVRGNGTTDNGDDDNDDDDDDDDDEENDDDDDDDDDDE